jgi:hypothetical protein
VRVGEKEGDEEEVSRASGSAHESGAPLPLAGKGFGLPRHEVGGERERGH